MCFDISPVSPIYSTLLTFGDRYYFGGVAGKGIMNDKKDDK